MTVVRNLMVRAGADFSSLNKEMKKAQKNVAEFKSGVQGALTGVAGALAGLSFVSVATDAARTAMDVEAAMMQINRLMGNSAHEFKQWSTDTAGAFNMSQAAAIKYGAIFGNLVSGFSSGTADTKDKTIDLLQASAVVASGTGRTMEDVMWRIRSGLLGNTEAIEDLGINVYVNMLKSTKAFQQFAGDKSWDQLDFNTQQLIRYYGILEQANVKFGASVNINTNSALQGLQAALGNVKMALGQAFLPILNIVLPILTRLANWLFRVISLWAMFVRALFGYKDPSKNMKKTTAAVGGMSEGFTDAGNAAAGVGKKATGSAKKTEKAAKKAKKALDSLAGFDEINTLSSAKNSDPEASADSGAGGGGGGGGGGIGGGGGGGLPGMEMPEMGNASAFADMSKKVKAVADKIRAIFFGLKNFMVRHKDIIISAVAGLAAGMAVALIAFNWSAIVGAITTAFTKLGGAIRTAWLAVTGPVGLVIAAVALVVGAFVYFYRTNDQFKGLVDGIFLKIKKVLLDLWDKVMVPFGKFLGSTFKKVWEEVGKAAKDLGDKVLMPLGKWLQGAFVVAWDAVKVAATWLWKNVLVPLGAYMKTFYKDILTPLGKVLKDVLATAFDVVVDIAKAFWKDVLVPLGNFVKTNFKPTVQALVDVLAFLWKNAFKPLAEYIGSTVLSKFREVTKVVKYLWNDVFKPLAGYMAGSLKNAFKTVGDVIGGLKTTFKGLMQFISGAFTGDWRKAWNGVKNIFKGIFDSLWGIVKYPLNKVIDGINRVIKGLNKIQIKVPGWVPNFGGQSYGVNIGYVPALAQGGYIGANKPLMAMIGDNKNEGEIVAPESKIYEQTSKAMKDAMGGQEIVINIGGTTVFRKLIDGINQAQRQAGKTLIEI